MWDTQLVTLREASKFFPKPLKKESIVRRIKKGIDGVQLRAEFDGFRWWTCEAWVKEFIDEITNIQLQRRKRKITPTELDWVRESMILKYGNPFKKESN